MTAMTVVKQEEQSFAKADDPSAILSKMSSFSFDNIRERLLKEGYLHEGNVDAAITEYQKFLTLFALGYHQVAMCSELVDEVWHTHILFTRDYKRFCDKIFGTFVHHKPNMESDPLAPGGVEAFFNAYTKVFGAMDPIWAFDPTASIQGCGYCGANYDDPDSEELVDQRDRN